uniref:SDR family oxidoreductase n=1 Tax=Pararhizobium sp. IMCC3301 TaxID=3067904 RepID=UPI00274175D6|nr:SDR family oxidoreductase [Pararhizobium sp. IMCC3301]
MATRHKSILITGCSSGIGYHCAHAMQQRGWQVFACVRKAADQQRLADEGLQVLYLDYTDHDSITKCVDDVLDSTDGRLEAVFNNGGYGQSGALEDLSVHALRDQFETNVFGWHELTRLLIPSMRHNKSGRIVQCSSVLGLVSMKYRGAYCASKHAVESLSDTMRMELMGSGVHVSLIEPGPIASRFVEHSLEAFHREIRIDASVHKEVYHKRLARMQRGGASRFKLGPEAVQKRLVHALESDRPRPRYYVTAPSYAMGFLKRVLSHRALSALLARSADRET